MEKRPKRIQRKKTSFKTEALDKAKDTINKLKAQIKQLRKQIKLLQEELELRTNTDFEDQFEIEPAENKRKCPQCGDSLIAVNAGIYKICKCNGCGWRKRSEA